MIYPKWGFGSLLRQFHLDSQSLSLGFTINLVSYSLTTKSRLPEAHVVLPIIHSFIQSEVKSDYTQVPMCTRYKFYKSKLHIRLFWQGLQNLKRLPSY